MNDKLPFEFIVDKDTHTLTIRREFAAGRQLVWDCHTKSELLDRWFAPKPLTAKTKSMLFQEGGHWIYAMVEPEGREHWARMDYLSIDPIDQYTALDGFCNDKGDLNTKLPRSNWKVTFRDKNDHSLVETLVTFKSTKELETVLQMGMKEGMISVLERLDELLAVLTK